MKWVTREHPHTDRIACPWLIRKFIDHDAEIVYVGRDEVLTYAELERATSFDAPVRDTLIATAYAPSKSSSRITSSRETPRSR